MVDPTACLFCKIVSGQMPAKKVYEDSNSIAFLDINPRNPGHTLIIPKKHYETIFEMPESEGGPFFVSMKRVASQVKEGTQAHGLSICQNNGSAAGQVVGHLHFHLIPRFLNEGPAALEAILPVKKMDDKSLDKIASTISATSSQDFQIEPEEEPEPVPEDDVEEEEPAHEPETETTEPPKEKKKKKSEEEGDDVDEFEEINFNL